MRLLLLIPLSFMIGAFGYARAVEISGNKAFSDETLAKNVNFDLPDDSLAAAVSDFYRQSGYFRVDIRNISKSKNGGRVVSINEGKPAKIDSIAVQIVPNDPDIIFHDMTSEYHGKVASKKNLDLFAKAYISRLSEAGRPFASGRWRDFSFTDSGDIKAVFWVLAGAKTTIGGFRYSGAKRSKAATLNRIVGIKPGTGYSESLVAEGEKTLDRQPFLEIEKPFVVEPRGNGDSSIIIYSLRELPSTRFDGAGGLVAEGDKTRFIGRLNSELGDIMGTGRAFGFKWNRKDRFSNELELDYLEPFVLGSGLDLGLSAFQIDRDSSFVKTGGSVGISRAFRAGLNASLWLTIERTVPEAERLVVGSIGRTLRLQFDNDRTDRAENPQSGYGIMTSVDYRNRTNSFSDSSNLPTKITAVGMEFRYYLRVSRRFVSAAKFSSWGIVSSDGMPQLDEFRFLGGFDNLRGYAENRFPAYRYIMVGLEPRLISGRYSRVYLFLDVADIKPNQNEGYKLRTGYGLGIVAPSTIGHFKLEVGWGQEDFPDMAVFNFGIAGRF